MTDEFDEVLGQLEPLRFTPNRSEAAARSGLQDFLNEAARLRPVVSAPTRSPLAEWLSQWHWESSPKMILAKVVIILTLILGGATATAFAAQGSLPAEPLYPIKLFIEDARLALTTDPAVQLNLDLEFADTRAAEMIQLTARGQAIPDDVPVRLDMQLQAALQVAAQLDDAHLLMALDQIQSRVVKLLQAMNQIPSGTSDNNGLQLAERALDHAQYMAQLGLTDPSTFRARVGNNRPNSAPTPLLVTPSSHTPMPTYTSTITPQPSLTLQPTYPPTNTPRPQSSITPQSYGPGPQPMGTPNMGTTPRPIATPVGQGGGHESGPGPQATDVPHNNPQPQPTSDGQGGSEPGPNATSEPGSGNSGTPQSGHGGPR